MKSDHRPSETFFTVVIPTYNRADLIHHTLETVFAQNYSNYEVLVVDNCSTDDTVERLQPLVEAGKIRLIVNEQNIERARARNVGFRNAKGDFLTLLDSDDYMYPDNLKDANSFIQSHPESQFFHNYYELVNAERKPVHQYMYPPKKAQLERLSKGNFISCIGVFLGKAVYTEFFFDEDERALGSEDWELWLRIRASHELGVIPKVNNGILLHPGRSITSYKLDAIIERKTYIIDKVLADPVAGKVYRQFETDMRAAVYVFVATTANEAHLFTEAKKYIKEAVRIKPRLLLDPHFLRVAQITTFKIQNKLKQEA